MDEVLANINEQNDAMEQINAAMGQPIGPSADIDEDDLEKEFEVSLTVLCMPMVFGREARLLDSRACAGLCRTVGCQAEQKSLPGPCRRLAWC